mmetsp:Transcript_23378/g.30533  ORF Transcript_23378/g.30533 Transcript_23378/m.30533 type:complete len:231 (-) Transcript_23378:303-995(-)
MHRSLLPSSRFCSWSGFCGGVTLDVQYWYTVFKQPGLLSRAITMLNCGRVHDYLGVFHSILESLLPCNGVPTIQLYFLCANHTWVSTAHAAELHSEAVKRLVQCVGARLGNKVHVHGLPSGCSGRAYFCLQLFQTPVRVRARLPICLHHSACPVCTCVDFNILVPREASNSSFILSFPKRVPERFYTPYPQHNGVRIQKVASKQGFLLACAVVYGLLWIFYCNACCSCCI